MNAPRDTSTPPDDPSYTIKVSSSSEALRIPSLGFGLYKIPSDEEGVKIISDAILVAGYRHFDSASIYGNEKALGAALAQCRQTILRDQLFVASKVWNDAQRRGRLAVRKSVLQSLDDLGLEYLDLCYVHWPVPGHFVETYQELLLLQKEGKIKHLGLSNFRIADYQELVAGVPPKDFVSPIVNQFEISPFLYRPKVISFFQDKGIFVAASKALNRATFSDEKKIHGIDIAERIATLHSVTVAQVLVRWSLQKRLIALTKTCNLLRMQENRDVLKFVLSSDEMEALDGITSPEVIRRRDELEELRRMS